MKINNQVPADREDNTTQLDEDSRTSYDETAALINKDNTVIVKTSVKLLLMRLPWFIIGLAILGVGVMLSRYRIDLPYEGSCDDDDNISNSTNLTALLL